VLGVSIGSHLGGARLLRNLPEVFAAEVRFELVLSGFGVTLGSHFGHVLDASLQCWMWKWELDWEALFDVFFKELLPSKYCGVH